jgi:hypothetical protein
MIESLDWLPSLKDLTVPALVAASYWVLKKLLSPCIQFLVSWIRSLRVRDLKRAKTMRSDPFTIERQLAKEGALFSAFLLCAVLSTTLIPFLVQTGKTTEVKLILFAIHITPVVVIEWWWLWHKEFVNVLIKEAARLGPLYRRTVTPRAQTPLRIQNRQARQAAIIASQATPSKYIGRRFAEMGVNTRK